MTHRPYPSVDRARHQLDRHDNETSPLATPRPMSPLEKAIVDYSAAAVCAVAPALSSMVTALRERPVVGVRQTKETT